MSAECTRGHAKSLRASRRRWAVCPWTSLPVSTVTSCGVSWLSTKPERGDHVRVTYEGVYSHQGGPSSVGYHVVKVVDQGFRHDAAAPPNAQIEVIRKGPPPEPPLDSLVTPSLGSLPTAIFVRESNGW